jgi:anti-sigma factor RsiW
MRCSSFEPLLDAYVEGELAPARRARVGAHLEGCASCAALLEELRAVDGLLLAPRRREPAPNFTFKVMAEVRAMPAARAPRFPHLAVLGTYVVFAWVAIGSFLTFGDGTARAMVTTIEMGFVRATSTFSLVAGATSRLFGGQTFDVTAAMGAMIAIDLVFAATIVALYAVLRARRAPIDGRTESC